MTKLEQIQSDNPERLLTTISAFFSTFKEEVGKKINEQEKTAIC